MKSSIFYIIPLVGFTLAQEGCTRRTITKTETERTYVTVRPSPVPSDITITSTIDITTTVTVRPSSSVEASATGLHWSNFPNGTWGNYTGRPKPTLSSVSLDYTDSAVTETPAPTSYVPGQGYSAISEAAIPTSEAVTAVETSAASSTSQSVQAQATSAAGSKTGEATFYGGNVSGGTCSFDGGYTIPSGLFGTALSDSNWNDAGNCGACVAVTGPSGNVVKAMIVDQCPGCGTNHLDLFPDAFAKLANPTEGVIPISWDIVPCGITSPFVLKNKSGTSKDWFSMQVVNSNVAVASLEVSTDGGKTWQATTRQTYNYFENSAGFGTQTVDVKVTSTSGQSIIVKGVSIAENTTKTASSNFS
ncbi:carbohydrate-binding module family 63 protein [Didymella exigua CBS 183.55]|uniref:Carbohydrate-binding module family 63 protein n=1 Tax=Didymella exigua CBS 183.55 TaxID=1150837 RepID=A0A6A5S7J3_9PLEO|nr:carbohydrate-binding module family 63 protein [Didymella exigua CBS 183.55]KAF1933477.1 carbohydrate-binding module family 63 protein [Didymella exigua CBS 183.55]